MELDEWQIYSQNQKLIFANVSGQTEKYDVSGVFGGYVESGDTYNELIQDNFIKLNDTNITHNRGNYSVLKDGSQIIVTFQWPHHAVEKNVASPPFIPLYVFNGDTLFNVSLSVAPPILTDSTDNYVDSVYFHKTLGIFQYTDIYNNTWTKTN